MSDLPLERCVVVAAPPRERCMAIIGGAYQMFPDVWIGEGRPDQLPTPEQHRHSMAWTGNPGTVHCGEKATLWVGYAACENHAAISLTNNVLHEVHWAATPACGWRSYHWSVTMRAHIIACHPELFGQLEVEAA